jgi:SAM-dependent methyltransferase
MRWTTLAKGLATYVPGLYSPERGTTGGTSDPRYCYSVWLRHLTMLRASGLPTDPEVVAELGPGDSLGLGLAALLSGASRYYALDVVRYAASPRNVEVLDQLVALFVARASIPGPDELPEAKPVLDGYEFPNDVLTPARLEQALAPSRVEAIRAALLEEGSDEGTIRIRYFAPWNDPEVIEEGSVDLIYSQAALEHVDDLDTTYGALRRWLAPDGVMSHQIDFRSHGTAKEWNGHWTYPDLLWAIVRGRRTYLLNRAPYSTHLDALRRHGFGLVHSVRVETPSEVPRSRLARRFRELSDEDLRTSGAYVQAVRG